MLDGVKAWVPYAYDAFEEHNMYATSISRKGMEVIRKIIYGKKIDQETSGMSKREWDELMASLKL